MLLFFLFLLIPLSGCHWQHQDNIIGKPIAKTITTAIEPYTWDFGWVKQGLILKHTFILKNESGKTLAIKDVHSSCGCTTSEVKKKILAPGEETLVEVKFNTTGYSGPVQQHVYVNTDDLDNPVIKYIIKAEVER